jgi:excisionase family DNA binding protein
MRRRVAQSLLDESEGGDQLLSTGEVAQLLGVSRQHVVDLVKRGDLPSSLVGTHRRIRRVDAQLVAAGDRRTSRDQRRSLLMAHAIAGQVVLDPDRARRIARENLVRMREGAARGGAKVWTSEWEQLVDGPLVDMLTALTSTSPRSRELRQNHPFAGLLSDAERQAVLALTLPVERKQA